MKARWFAAIAFAPALMLHAAAAAAQSATAEAMSRWGLLGWWAARCDLPPSSGNSYYGFVVEPDGRVYLERDYGNSGNNDRNEVVSAELRLDGTLGITINFARFKQARLNVYAKSEGRVRVVYNRGPGNDVSVENGILRHNGQPTPWSQKCR